MLLAENEYKRKWWQQSQKQSFVVHSTAVPALNISGHNEQKDNDSDDGGGIDGYGDGDSCVGVDDDGVWGTVSSFLYASSHLVSILQTGNNVLQMYSFIWYHTTR